MSKYFFIHGAWASKNSFNYVVDNIDSKEIELFEYCCQKENPEDIIKRAVQEVKKFDGDVTIVGHSLGGILATHLHKHAKRIVTVAAPLNGVDSLNFMMHYLLAFYAPVFKHITPNARFIKDMHADDYSDTKFDVIVACNGYNIAMPNKPSDGTISIESQIAWTPTDATIHKVDANHHEVLIHPKTVDIIKAVRN